MPGFGMEQRQFVQVMRLVKWSFILGTYFWIRPTQNTNTRIIRKYVYIRLIYLRMRKINLTDDINQQNTETFCKIREVYTLMPIKCLLLPSFKSFSLRCFVYVYIVYILHMTHEHEHGGLIFIYKVIWFNRHFAFRFFERPSYICVYYILSTFLSCWLLV